VKSVIVIDYGIGNLHSVVKGLKHQGAEVTVTSDPSEVSSAERLVLPGVGAFGDGMRELQRRNLIDPIHQFVATGRPFLGICLGMQLLLSESEEFGRHTGLGIIPGKVVAIPHSPGIKVPHIGWRSIQPPAGTTWTQSLMQDVEENTMMYFVHSYTAVPSDESRRLADAQYGTVRISAAIRHQNVTGCQFHPEKSGVHGLKIIHRFLQ